MPLPFIAQVLIMVALQVAAYVLMPKPKGPKPAEVQEMENPTADAGTPVPVIFGEIEIRSPNVIWYGDKATVTYDA